MNLYSLIRPLVFALDAETAHRASIAALRAAPVRSPPAFPDSLHSRVAGIDFTSPVGLAAGFDKSAEVPQEILSLGFGFVEVGTVTPRPQAGNPRPRLFRLRRDRAVINRMGFNNDGQPAAFDRLLRCTHVHGVIGVNVGANKDSPDWVADYVSGVLSMGQIARYVTINISSPNTPGLRGLQDAGALDALLEAVAGAGLGKPVFLKVSPDLGDGDHDRIVRAATDHGIDAIIIGNTTTSRPPLRSRRVLETGGLSGAPLGPLALDGLRKFRKASGGEMVLIAAGGIATAEDAWERIRAGASLVQIYTAMIYEGPGIARRMARGLAAILRREGFVSVGEAVGTEA